MEPTISVDPDSGIAARVQPADGEKVLWIHGYTMDSSIWAELWGLLPDWHHIGVDLPGHGASRAVPVGGDLAGLARDIARLASEHQVRHLVALSFGTVLALEMSIQRPDAFASLILGAPVLTGGPHDAAIRVRYEELVRLYRERGPGSHLRTLWMTSPPDIFKGTEARPELRRNLSAVIDEHLWRELAGTSNYLFAGVPHREEDLRKIRSSTLILLGQEELPHFKRCAELIRRSIPDCRREYVAHAGHLCLLEAASEVAGPISQHLRRCAAGSPA